MKIVDGQGLVSFRNDSLGKYLPIITCTDLIPSSDIYLQ